MGPSLSNDGSPCTSDSSRASLLARRQRQRWRAPRALPYAFALRSAHPFPSDPA